MLFIYTDMNRNKVTLQDSADIVAHYKVGIRGKELLKLFPQYSKSTVYEHAKRKVGESRIDKRHGNKGRPPKLDARDKRLILRQIPILRKEYGSFTSKRVQVESGLTDKVSNRTVRRCLNGNGYGYRRSRKKGLLVKKDLSKRVAFARKVRKLLPEDFWKTGISFYLDAAGFTYKTNPCNEAACPKAREWRRANEGLTRGCTAKGKKEGSKQAHFIAAISYGKGFICCEQYHGKMCGKLFAEFVKDNFEEVFEKSSNPRAKRFLQDGCPSQNSKVAKRAIDGTSAKMFAIPARSPDLNPIENIFHLTKRKLQADALDKRITNETFEEFSNRVRKTLLDFPTDVIDRTIDSMDKRIAMIVKAKGQRIKY